MEIVLVHAYMITCARAFRSLGCDCSNKR